MADDLKPLLLEMKATNAGLQTLVQQGIDDDTPSQLLAGNIFEILNAQALFSQEKKLIQGVINQEKTTDLNLKKLFEEGSPIFQLVGATLEVVGMSLKEQATAMEERERQMVEFVSDELSASYEQMEMIGTKQSEVTRQMGDDIINNAKQMNKESKSRQKEEKKDKINMDKGYFAELKDSLTSGYKAMSDSFSELSNGIIGKAGFATGLLLVVSGLLAAFPRLAEMTGIILTGIGNFFSDIGLFLSGDLTLSEFANRNPLGIVLASFFAMTESAKKLFNITKAIFLRIIAIPLAIVNTLFTSFDQGMRKFEAGGGFFGFIGSMVDGLFTGLAQFIKDTFSFVLGLLPTRFQEFIDPFTSFVSEAFQRVIDFFSNMNLFGLLGDTVDSIVGFFTGDKTKDLSTTIEPKAMGGAVAGGSPYLVGEKGPELFVPGAAGGIIPNGMGSAPIIVNNNQVNQSSNTANHQHSNVSITDSQQEITGL